MKSIIIKVPVLHRTEKFPYNDIDYPLIPSLGMGTITAFLREKGITISQMDLDAQIHYEIVHERYYFNFSIFSEKDRVYKYLEGYTDGAISYSLKKIISRLKDKKYDLILLSVPTTGNISPYLLGLALAKELKETYKCVIGIGGDISYFFISELKQAMKRWTFLDFTVEGRAEFPIYNIIKCIERNHDWHHVPGIIYSKENILIENKKECRMQLMAPDFSDINLKHYTWKPSHSNKKIVVLPYMFINGCSNKCIFCDSSKFNGVYTTKNTTDIIKDLKKLSEQYSTKYFYFLNDTTNVSKKYILELCKKIIDKKLNILWTCCCRFNEMDKNTLWYMKKAGCIVVIWGLETASERLLTYVEKGITVENALNILKESHSLGIWNGLELIPGLPTERDNDIDKTIKFINNNKGYIDEIHITPFYLIKNSKLFCNAKKYGLTNVREVNQYATMEANPLTNIYIFYAFDEVNGLSWIDKKKQIIKSFNKISEYSLVSLPFRMYVRYQLLFYLYTLFKKKKDIKRRFNLSIKKVDYMARDYMVRYKKKISVVVITYNRQESLRKCLVNLHAQDYSKEYYEIIVIDDGSTDTTAQIIKGLQKDYKNLFYFRQEHNGTAHARNLGIKKSKGKIIAFIDDDCLTDKNWVKKTIKEHDKHPEYPSIGGKTIIGDTTFLGKYKNFQLGFFFTEMEYKKDFITKLKEYHNVQKKLNTTCFTSMLPTCNISYKATLFKEIGLFNIHLKFSSGEDTEFHWRLKQKGYAIFYQPGIVVRHFPEGNIFSHFRRSFQYGLPIPKIIKFNKNYPERVPNSFVNLVLSISDIFFATILKIVSIKKLLQLVLYAPIILLDEMMYRIGIMYSYTRKL